MRSMTTCVLAAPPWILIWPAGSRAVITALARFCPAALQLMLEFPGHGMLAGKTATKPPLPSVSVIERLITAPRAPAKPSAIVRSSPSASLPPVVLVSRTRGVVPVNGTNDCVGGVDPTVTPRTLDTAGAKKRTAIVVPGSTVLGVGCLIETG